MSGISGVGSGAGWDAAARGPEDTDAAEAALLDKLAQIREGSAPWLPQWAKFLDGSGEVSRLAARVLSDGTVSAEEVERLVRAAYDWSEMNAGERQALVGMLREHAHAFEPAARRALARFLGVADPLAATADRPAPPAPARPGEPIELGLPAVAGQRYAIDPRGFPVQLGAGEQGPPGLRGEGAERIYRAGRALVEAPVGVLRSVPAEVQQRLLQTATGQYDRALEAVQGSRLRDDEANKVRSGAAATLLALYEGAASPELKQQAAEALLERALAEPIEGLRANVYLNLEPYKDALSPANRARLERLQELVLPSKPPYEEWFPTGNETFEVVHYAHDECWVHATDPVTEYRRMGLQVTEEGVNERGEQFWVLEGTVRGERGGEQKTRIRLIKSHQEFVRDMDDPNVHAIFYSGHSNLGGNVSEAVRRGPAENGKKLLHFGLCRGQQNIYEVVNKYPNAQLSTSHDPSYFANMMPLVKGVLQGVADRGSYDEINRQTHMAYRFEDVTNYIRPNELRRYEYVDHDLDGQPELGLDARDRFYDVLTRTPSRERTDLVPRPEPRAAIDVPGEALMNGVNFTRTLITYHVEKSHGRRTALHEVVGDRIEAAGWFEGPPDEAVRVTEGVGRDGKPVYNVSVNKAFSQQSAYAIGALIQYEFTRHVLEKDGRFTPEEKARALLMVGEYLSYMYCSTEEARAITRAIGERAGVRGLSFERLYAAIESDQSGYATDGQVRELMRRVTIR
ncbi:MAG: hypothetical protein KatS3mg102_1522 [Planctomycetota bacterium]|nr:MAG: hypothetical protein KatS3mg102_1522 [Planctomycetota bacterium]